MLCLFHCKIPKLIYIYYINSVWLIKSIIAPHHNNNEVKWVIYSTHCNRCEHATWNSCISLLIIYPRNNFFSFIFWFYIGTFNCSYNSAKKEQERHHTTKTAFIFNDTVQRRLTSAVQLVRNHALSLFHKAISGPIFVGLQTFLNSFPLFNCFSLPLH